MKKGFPISRNVRAQWLLQHLDTVISIDKPEIDANEIPELEVVSVIPKDSSSWTLETRYYFRYKITPSTIVKFLAHKYKMVFSLDLSPSLASVVIKTCQRIILIFV